MKDNITDPVKGAAQGVKQAVTVSLLLLEQLCSDSSRMHEEAAAANALHSV